ncbi:peptidoglycan-binding protein [Oxalobacteraceae bacterium]|nr:peptidoglycan-binding protein [Oxalobacteraceae bacterium]
MRTTINVSKGGASVGDVASPLARAEHAALAQSDSQAVDSAVVACPYSPQALYKVIEIRVIGEDDSGLDGIAMVLVRGDGRLLRGKTGPAGSYRFTGIGPGGYQLMFPELDEDAWMIESTTALAESEASCTSMANWQTPVAPAVAHEVVHIVKQGECVGKIAEMYGFFPATIWDHPANASLKALRHANMYVLSSNDRLVIPPKRQKPATGTGGDRFTVRRKGVPERLRIRFLRYDATPRSNVPFLLSLVTQSGDPVADIAGNTDDAGFVDQPIPPSAIRATVTLVLDEAEVHQFKLGYTNPVDQVSGWQARLNMLGYDCGPEDDNLGPRTEAAIRAFQRGQKLPETGKQDEPTRQALLALALS